MLWQSERGRYLPEGVQTDAERVHVDSALQTVLHTHTWREGDQPHTRPRIQLLPFNAGFGLGPAATHALQEPPGMTLDLRQRTTARTFLPRGGPCSTAGAEAEARPAHQAVQSGREEEDMIPRMRASKEGTTRRAMTMPRTLAT